MDNEFYDLVYESRQTGKGPDVDTYDDCRARGYEPGGISLEMVYPKQAGSS